MVDISRILNARGKLSDQIPWLQTKFHHTFLRELLMLCVWPFRIFLASVFLAYFFRTLSDSMKEILNNIKDQHIRANFFNSTITAALLYGCETWSLTQSERKKLAVTQRAIERRMLNIRRRDIHNEKIRTVTKVRDANDLARRAKHHWAGHICRLTDHRWT